MQHTILKSIDDAREEFKSHIDSCSHPDKEHPQYLNFAWSFNNLRVKIGFTLTDSPIGFPYSKVTTYLWLNDKKISRKKLEHILQTVEDSK